MSGRHKAAREPETTRSVIFVARKEIERINFKVFLPSNSIKSLFS